MFLNDFKNGFIREVGALGGRNLPEGCQGAIASGALKARKNSAQGKRAQRAPPWGFENRNAEANPRKGRNPADARALVQAPPFPGDTLPARFRDPHASRDAVGSLTLAKDMPVEPAQGGVATAPCPGLSSAALSALLIWPQGQCVERSALTSRMNPKMSSSGPCLASSRCSSCWHQRYRVTTHTPPKARGLAGGMGCWLGSPRKMSWRGSWFL